MKINNITDQHGGQYVPKPGDGQYVHQPGPTGPPAPAYEHVTGSTGASGPGADPYQHVTGPGGPGKEIRLLQIKNRKPLLHQTICIG